MSGIKITAFVLVLLGSGAVAGKAEARWLPADPRIDDRDIYLNVGIDMAIACDATTKDDLGRWSPLRVDVGNGPYQLRFPHRKRRTRGDFVIYSARMRGARFGATYWHGDPAGPRLINLYLYMRGDPLRLYSGGGDSGVELDIRSITIDETAIASATINDEPIVFYRQ